MWMHGLKLTITHNLDCKRHGKAEAMLSWTIRPLKPDVRATPLLISPLEGSFMTNPSPGGQARIFNYISTHTTSPEPS